MPPSIARCQKFAPLAAALILAGCAGAPQLYEVKSVYLCASEECGPAGQKVSTEQVLRGLQRLFQANEGQPYKVCSSNVQSRHCESPGVGYFVMGGPIPGRGAQNSGTFKGVQVDAASQSIGFSHATDLTFNGSPLVCAPHPGKLTVRSADEISLTDEPYYCNWMAVGNMVTTFSFAVESIDLDRGRLGGYWAHAVSGTGNGKGNGYAVIELPRAMPRGEDWLAP
jgi:hypothetical protein